MLFVVLLVLGVLLMALLVWLGSLENQADPRKLRV